MLNLETTTAKIVIILDYYKIILYNYFLYKEYE